MIVASVGVALATIRTTLVPTLQRGSVTWTLQRPDETAGAVIQGSHAGGKRACETPSVGIREHQKLSN